jgi:HK97 family phage major capsid protein
MRRRGQEQARRRGQGRGQGARRARGAVSTGRASRATTSTAAKRELELKDFNHARWSRPTASRRSRHSTMPATIPTRRPTATSCARASDLLTAEEVKTSRSVPTRTAATSSPRTFRGRIVKKVYETSPVRQIASVQTISTDALEGIEDNRRGRRRLCRRAHAGGDTTTPQVGKWRIPVFWIDTEPKATQQLLDDAASTSRRGWRQGGRQVRALRELGVHHRRANKILGFVKGYTAAADSARA